MSAHRLSKKQQLMIASLYPKMGNIKKACEEVGISRQTHYNWEKNNTKYAEAVSQIDEELDDFAESKLFKNIEKGDQRAIEFRLKKSKTRGYVETVDHKHSSPNGGPIEHTEITRKEIEKARKLIESKL